MTKHTIRGMTAAICGVILAAGAAEAQPSLSFGTGVGASMPVGDLGEAYNLGWNAQANLGVTSPTWPVALRFDVQYHSLSGEDNAGVGAEDLRILAGIANAELFVARSNGGGFFVIGGAGIYNADAEGDVGDSSTDFGVLFGGGYKIAMTNLLLSLEGKFHNVFADAIDTQFVPVNIVVEIPFGGR